MLYFGVYFLQTFVYGAEPEKCSGINTKGGLNYGQQKTTRVGLARSKNYSYDNREIL